ncbi:MAG: hypothetical protein NTW87_33840, partial [Planctomycetota bacterium]|nr:hypothetical protein [Planctomycetota bacterium]
MVMLEDVFVLPVGSRRLVFSPRRGFAAGVNAAAVRELAALAKDGPLTLPSPHGGEGKTTTAGVQAIWDALGKPPAAVPQRAGPARPVFLGLIVTRRCNMACRYCDFGGSGNDGPPPTPLTLASPHRGEGNEGRPAGP